MYKDLLDIARVGAVSSGDVSVGQWIAEADRDADGNSISGSKKAKVLDYIDRQDLTSDQKGSLYMAFGYVESTLSDAPWHEGEAVQVGVGLGNLEFGFEFGG